MGFLKGLFQPGWEKARARAERCVASRDFGGAIEALDRAIESAPVEEQGSLEAWRSEVRQTLAANHLEAARDHGRIGDRATMRERLELAVSFAEDEGTRALAEEELKKLLAEEKALEEAQRAGMREPDAGEVSDEELLLALTAAFPDEMQEAYEEADEGLRRAAAALQQGRVEEALAYFDGVSEELENPLVRFEQGRALLHVGRVEEALEAFRRADSGEVEWIPVKLARAEAAVEAGEVEEAEEVLQAAHDLDPEDLEVYVAICRTALHSSDPAYGLDAAGVVLEQHPGHRGMLLMKGRLLAKLERLDEAWEVYDAAVRAGFRYDATSRTLNTDLEASLLLVELTMRRGEGYARAEEVLGTLSGVLDGQRRRRVDTILAALVGASGREEEARALWDELLPQAEAEEDNWVLLAEATSRGDGPRAEELLASLGEDEREGWERDSARFFGGRESAERA